MDAEDLQELYKLVRGSRSAVMVMDAKGLFQEKKMSQAMTLLGEARDVYAEGRTRLFRQQPDASAKGKEAERQAKRITRKQKQAKETLQRFDELIGQLERLAEREERQQAKLNGSKPEPAAAPTSLEPDSGNESDLDVEQTLDLDSDADIEPATESRSGAADGESELPPARPHQLSEAFSTSYAAASSEERLDLVGREFGFRQVRGEPDILPDTLYFIHSGEKSFLVRTSTQVDTDGDIELVGAVDDRSMKPMSRKAFLKLGKKRRMVLLTEKHPVGVTDASDDDASADAVDDDSDDESEPKVLDIGAFSQLLTSAQRSGLVPSADQIAHVRDREFRLGKYDLAFQTIDGLYNKFTASMNQRNQRLIREDADIASGKVEMSPKDLQAKRARDRQQTQEIERARRRFQVVLEGLRLLMHRE